MEWGFYSPELCKLVDENLEDRAVTVPSVGLMVVLSGFWLLLLLKPAIGFVQDVGGVGSAD